MIDLVVDNMIGKQERMRRRIESVAKMWMVYRQARSIVEDDRERLDTVWLVSEGGDCGTGG